VIILQHNVQATLYTE